MLNMMGVETPEPNKTRAKPATNLKHADPTACCSEGWRAAPARHPGLRAHIFSSASSTVAAGAVSAPAPQVVPAPSHRRPHLCASPRSPARHHRGPHPCAAPAPPARSHGPQSLTGATLSCASAPAHSPGAGHRGPHLRAAPAPRPNGPHLRAAPTLPPRPRRPTHTPCRPPTPGAPPPTVPSPRVASPRQTSATSTPGVPTPAPPNSRQLPPNPGAPPTTRPWRRRALRGPGANHKTPDPDPHGPRPRRGPTYPSLDRTPAASG